MMFNCLDGGVVEPISFGKEELTPDRSIIVMDEENLRVWLWHGKQRALVPRRTALRQAQSLKGHGYQAGNAIVGRGLNDIVEIDDRKVGRVPEETENSENLMKLLTKSFRNVGNFVYVEDLSGASEPMAAPKVQSSAPAPTPAPKPTPTVSAPAPTLAAVPSASSYGSVPAAAAPTPSETKSITGSKLELLKGAVIMAVLSEFKDLWISRKEGDVISLEQMDGKICSFKIENGQVVFQTGAFAEVPSDKKVAIEAKVKDLEKTL